MKVFIITFKLLGHKVAFGLVFDITTLTNFIMIVIVFWAVRWLSKSANTAAWVVSISWLLLELEAAYRFEWEGCCPGNLGDVGELAMAVGLSLLFRYLFMMKPGDAR